MSERRFPEGWWILPFAVLGAAMIGGAVFWLWIGGVL